MSTPTDITEANLKDTVKGWFIGNFDPTLYKTEAGEVAVKRYKAGESEKMHYHKIATEFTVVVTGEIQMNGKHYTKDAIVIVPPGKATDFKAITDTTTTVVKIPGTPDDKYYVDA